MTEEIHGQGRKYSKEEVAEVLARYRASGLTRVRFAQQEGISAGRLHYWVYGRDSSRSRSSEVVKGSEGSVFKEVKVAAVLPGISRWAAEVSLPRGMAVRFSALSRPEWIGAVVQALQRSC